MSLRRAPLPRMAGHLTFMRARHVPLDRVPEDGIAILGVPMETPGSRRAGQRFAPMALRETSVYFGWHANAQFSHPVDVDARTAIDARSVDARMVDLGDVATRGRSLTDVAEDAADVLAHVRRRRATLLVLAGDPAIVAPLLSRAAGGPSRYVQFGGALEGSDAPLAALAPHLQGRWTAAAPASAPSVEFWRSASATGAMILSDGEAEAMGRCEWAERLARCRGGSGLDANVDLSAVDGRWHGAVWPPRSGGLSLAALGRAMAALGALRPQAVVLTGLNPTLSGLARVKTGQRLFVTAVLSFIYGRLGLVPDLAAPDLEVAP